MVIKTKSFLETQKAGGEFAKEIKDGGVVCLYGDLGAGKTTFVQGVARALGIEGRVVSPTFIIVRKYKNFWHVDLYRMNSIEEIDGLGLAEICADPKNIVFIEWPERMGKLLPKKRWEVKFNQIGDNEREISYEIIY